MTQIKRAGFWDILLLLFVAMIWGSAFSAIKISVAELGPIWTAAARVTFGFLILVPFNLFTKAKEKTKVIRWRLLAIIAFLNMVLPFALISWGMKSVDAGVASLLMGTTPFFAMILGHIFTTDEKINIYKFVGVIFGLTSVALIVADNFMGGVSNSSILAQGAILVSAFCYVVSGLLMRRVDMQPVEFTTLALGIGSAMLLLAAFVIEGAPIELPSQKTILALIWLGLFPTGLGYLLRFYLVKRIGFSTFALGMNSVPAFGIMWGAVLLHEEIETRTIIALLLVVLGLQIARMGTKPKNDEKPDEKTSKN